MESGFRGGGAQEGAGKRLSDVRAEARLDYEEERARHERIKADLAEIKLQVETNSYLPREIVAAAAATVIATFSQGMRSIGPNLERTLGLSPEVAESIEVAIDDCLAALADSLEAMTRLPGSGNG